MRLSRWIKIQLAIFGVVTAAAGTIMVLGYLRLPAMFGVGRYTVTVQLPRAGGLYASGNVTYRGTEVGRITSVHLTATGVEAVLSLRNDVSIPSDLDAQVHSVSAVGEQYIALQPRSGRGPALKNGDVIPLGRATVPPDINSLLDAANRGLRAIPRDNLKTAVDESYTAVGGLGPDIARLIKGSTTLAIDARANLDPLTTLIDQSGPVLDSQAGTADAIRGWAAHLATITRELHANDTSVAGMLANGPSAANEARRLVDRLQPTLPLLLANLVSVGQVALAYHPALEQLLVLIPEGVAMMQGAAVANKDTKHPGLVLDFKLNLNLPTPCTTGFLPIQQQRVPTFEDAPNRPGGLYCRIPKDSPKAVRGARNYPCLTVPGKRAPTVKMCESNEEYVPLNDGNDWKGDPNGTLSGQDLPLREDLAHWPPGTPQEQAPPLPGLTPPDPPPLIAAAEYDPATGTYIGPDGHSYTQANLAQNAPKEQTWQTMLIPSTNN